MRALLNEKLKQWNCLSVFSNILWQGKTVKWFTDNQNCVDIVQSGSMKLHVIARNMSTKGYFN